MEETKNNPSEDTIVEQTGMNEAVEGKPEQSSPSVKDLIAQITGWKDLPDDDTAIKRVKDLQSYVGTQQTQKEMEAAKKLTESGQFITKEQYETDMFFTKNEQYSRDRDLIEALAAKHNISPREAVSLDTYKSLSEKISGYEKAKESENVLKSNPRIAETRNTLEKSRAALKEGNFKGAEDQSVKAILENLGE
jgi:hypothetical protein